MGKEMTSLATVDQYVYEPLTYDREFSKPIRLLKILPGDPGSTICCELFKTYLSTSEDRELWDFVKKHTRKQTNESLVKPEYYALSYMWGDAQDRIPIHVNGKQLLVTRNLESFLRRQKDTFSQMDKMTRIFWIDAICIDQTNVDERSRQVAFMHGVYKEAEIVIVWLGEPTSYMSVAFTALLRNKCQYRLLPSAEKVAISETFDSGYWERLWIVQELYHARNIIVRSGSFEISWNTLGHMTHHASKIGQINLNRRDLGYMDTLISDQSQVVDHGMHVLDRYGSRNCLDPRDSVYALRSLRRTLMSLVPDYSLSIAQVYKAAAIAIISGSQSIELLEATSRRKPSLWNLAFSNDLPSWAPDWKMPRYGSLDWLSKRDPKFGYNRNYTKANLPEVLSWATTGCLLLKGIFIDTVIDSTKQYEHPKEDWNKIKVINQLHSWLPKCTATFFRDKCGLTVELRGDETKPLSPGSVTLELDTLLNHYFQLLGYQQSFFDTFTAGMNPRNLLELEGNSVFLTKTGYGGIALGEPKMGDLVFVAYGSGYPYIIRRTKGMEESYTLIGCAFIKGLMDWEALKLKEAGILVDRTISLV